MSKPQTIDEMTVEAVQVDGRRWWVWRDEQGRQLHAGMAPHQCVKGPEGYQVYEFDKGQWQRAKAVKE